MLRVIEVITLMPTVIDNNNSKINYFHQGLCQKADRRVNAKIA